MYLRCNIIRSTASSMEKLNTLQLIAQKNDMGLPWDMDNQKANTPPPSKENK